MFFSEHSVLGDTPNWPMPFISFLTFVVDNICLVRNTSALHPLRTRKIHMNKYGAPDTTPFYNVSTVDLYE